MEGCVPALMPTVPGEGLENGSGGSAGDGAVWEEAPGQLPIDVEYKDSSCGLSSTSIV